MKVERGYWRNGSFGSRATHFGPVALYGTWLTVAVASDLSSVVCQVVCHLKK